MCRNAEYDKSLLSEAVSQDMSYGALSPVSDASLGSFIILKLRELLRKGQVLTIAHFSLGKYYFMSSTVYLVSGANRGIGMGMIMTSNAL
jgi:hypothetical protein